MAERAPMPAPRSHVGRERWASACMCWADDDRPPNWQPTRPLRTGSDQWSTRRHLPTARSALASAAVGGLLYAVGGFRRSALRQRRRDPSGRNEAYDPASDRWWERAPLRVARGHLAAAAYRGALLVAGGNGRLSSMAATARHFPGARRTIRHLTSGRTQRRWPVTSTRDRLRWP